MIANFYISILSLMFHCSYVALIYMHMAYLRVMFVCVRSASTKSSLTAGLRTAQDVNTNFTWPRKSCFHLTSWPWNIFFLYKQAVTVQKSFFEWRETHPFLPTKWVWFFFYFIWNVLFIFIFFKHSLILPQDLSYKCLISGMCRLFVFFAVPWSVLVFYIFLLLSQKLCLQLVVVVSKALLPPYIGLLRASSSQGNYYALALPIILQPPAATTDASKRGKRCIWAAFVEDKETTTKRGRLSLA